MAHENGEFIGDNHDLYDDVLEMKVIKLTPALVDDDLGMAEYRVVSKQVRYLKADDSFVENLSVSSEIQWGKTREKLIAIFTLQKEEVSPVISACLDSMIETLENEV